MLDSPKLPELESFDDYGFNPTLYSSGSDSCLPFYKTQEYFYDNELYGRFIQNSVKRFRHSRTYTHYKGYLINDIGLDTCQIHSNIKEGMATIEMHHMLITIYDVALIICEHMLKTVGYISTFDLVKLLREEHINNRVPLVMISLTAHQEYHADELVIPIDSIFGDWTKFIIKYQKGITLDIAYKILFYIQNSNNDKELSNELLNIRDNILSWAIQNDN